MLVKVVKRRPLFSKNSIAAQLRLAKLDLNKLIDRCVLWRDETKVEISEFKAKHHFGKNQTLTVILVVGNCN